MKLKYALNPFYGPNITYLNTLGVHNDLPKILCMRTQQAQKLKNLAKIMGKKQLNLLIFSKIELKLAETVLGSQNC